MPVKLRGQTYYRTAETCRMIGISRSTLVRWLARGILKDASHRDIRGWRLFTKDDVREIEEVANKVS